MAEIFGAGTGVSQAIQDLHTLGLSDLQAAQARKAESEAKQSEQERALYARLALATAGDTPIAQRLDNTARALMGISPVKAATMAKDAASIRQNEASAARQKAQGLAAQYTIEAKKTEGIAQYFDANVNDQASLDVAKQLAEQMHALPEWLKTATYSPELKKAVTSGLMTAAQKAHVKAEEARRLEQKRLDDARISGINSGIQLRQARIDKIKEDMKLIGKDGMTPVQRAKAEEINALKEEQRKATALKNAVTLRKNPGLSPDNPIPLVEGLKPEVGSHYADASGRVALMTPQGMKILAPGAIATPARVAATVMPSRTESDDDELEDQ